MNISRGKREKKESLKGKCFSKTIEARTSGERKDARNGKLPYVTGI